MDLKKFDKYKKTGKVQAINNNKELWMYTRVSSKEQFTNSSIDEQRSSIENYAKLNNYKITKEHGGTYESASGDLTRKEFKNLIESIKKETRRPYAIAIKFLSRFSRTGGGAIGLVEQLVNDIGVHLIETSTGLTTENENDKLQMYDKLLESKRENIQRLERTIPGMKKLLSNGNWLGKAPRGYTMYGSRVSNFNNRNQTQKIVINEEGKILKKAWQWKAEGMCDSDIRYKLKDLYQFKISKQSLSAMWRKPFYVGINNNAMLDEVVKGNWPALITEEIWDKVQYRLESTTRKSGYEKAPVSKNRPLTGFIYCSECGAPITSYIAKKKKVHYYKCQHGKGGNMNAFSTPRSRKPGVNNSFIEFLAKFELDEDHKKLLKAQIIELNQEHQISRKKQSKGLKNELLKLELKLDKINEKFILSDNADEVAYVKIKNQLEKEIEFLKEKLNNTPKDLSNQEDLIDKALNFCQNISEHWASGDIHQKLKIQKTLFPDGLVINPETRRYRTKKMNLLLSAIEDIAGVSESKSNKKSHRKGGLSYLVAGTGLEPVTFGL